MTSKIAKHSCTLFTMWASLTWSCFAPQCANMVHGSCQQNWQQRMYFSQQILHPQAWHFLGCRSSLGRWCVTLHLQCPMAFEEWAYRKQLLLLFREPSSSHSCGNNLAQTCGAHLSKLWLEKTTNGKRLRGETSKSHGLPTMQNQRNSNSQCNGWL